MGWRLVGDPERRVSHPQLGDDVLGILGTADPIDLHGAECRLVELDSRPTTPYRQLRHDARLEVPTRPMIHFVHPEVLPETQLVRGRLARP